MSGHLHTLLVLCLLLSLALAAKKPGKKPGKPNKPSKPSKPSKPTATVATFEASRDVTAKGKVFSCKYVLTYKAAAGKLAVDKKRSKVACSPDSKGNFGKVTETFDVAGFSVKVRGEGEGKGNHKWLILERVSAKHLTVLGADKMQRAFGYG